MGNKDTVCRLNRETVERLCANSVLKPELRAMHMDREIFIADGLSLYPEKDFARFGCEPGDFSGGAYCTLWFVGKSEDYFEVGAPALYRLSHNPEYDYATKKQARINRALKDARDFINTLKRVERPVNALVI